MVKRSEVLYLRTADGILRRSLNSWNCMKMWRQDLIWQGNWKLPEYRICGQICVIIIDVRGELHWRKPLSICLVWFRRWMKQKMSTSLWRLKHRQGSIITGVLTGFWRMRILFLRNGHEDHRKILWMRWSVLEIRCFIRKLPMRSIEPRLISGSGSFMPLEVARKVWIWILRIFLSQLL